MSLFENGTDEEFEVKGGGVARSVNESNATLQDFLREFKVLRNTDEDTRNLEKEEVFIDEDDEHGEEYEVSEEESASIESFLNEDGVENEYDLEYDEENLEYEYDEDDFDYFEEGIEYGNIEELESDSDNNQEEAIDVQVEINELPDLEDDLDDLESLVSQEDETENVSDNSNLVTSDEIDKKFDEFEKRLLEKIMQQLAGVQTMPSQPEHVNNTNDDKNDEINIKTVKGKLVINGYEFTGEVVMFTPLESLKQASWEEVVRRKGHCTYHLTTSGNGGWFIKKSNAPNPYAYIEKKEEAEELAKFYASREKAELKIHNSKGVIEKSLSFGREKLRG